MPKPRHGAPRAASLRCTQRLLGLAPQLAVRKKALPFDSAARVRAKLLAGWFGQPVLASAVTGRP